MAEVKSRISRAWQMCVVDRSQVSFDNAPRLMRAIKQDAAISNIKDGDVVFVITTTVKLFRTYRDGEFDEVRNVPRYSILDGIPYANIWNPRTSSYGWIMQDILHPILNAKDVIEMEMKFSISLEEQLD